MGSTTVDIFLWLSYILLIIAVLATIAFAVMYMVKHPNSSKNTIIGIVGLLVVIGISYALSSPDTAGRNIDGGLARWIGAGIISMYILLILAVLGWIGSEIASQFK